MPSVIIPRVNETINETISSSLFYLFLSWEPGIIIRLLLNSKLVRCLPDINEILLKLSTSCIIRRTYTYIETFPRDVSSTCPRQNFAFTYHDPSSRVITESPRHVGVCNIMTARNAMTVSDYGIISFAAARASKFEILGRFTGESRR